MARSKRALRPGWVSFRCFILPDLEVSVRKLFSVGNAMFLTTAVPHEDITRGGAKLWYEDDSQKGNEQRTHVRLW